MLKIQLHVPSPSPSPSPSQESAGRNEGDKFIAKVLSKYEGVALQAPRRGKDEGRASRAGRIMASRLEGRTDEASGDEARAMVSARPDVVAVDQDVVEGGVNGDGGCDGEERVHSGVRRVWGERGRVAGQRRRAYIPPSPPPPPPAPSASPSLATKSTRNFRPAAGTLRSTSHRRPKQKTITGPRPISACTQVLLSSQAPRARAQILASPPPLTSANGDRRVRQIRRRARGAPDTRRTTHTRTQ
ncbi:hypothetical protein BC628DRAFT_316057 [Trametes gibbosa]|nr:hypothetical protein BC628DRAFT_316057 [Trametes gibbosa]